mgnify:FL=1
MPTQVKVAPVNGIGVAILIINVLLTILIVAGGWWMANQSADMSTLKADVRDMQTWREVNQPIVASNRASLQDLLMNARERDVTIKQMVEWMRDLKTQLDSVQVQQTAVRALMERIDDRLSAQARGRGR